LATFVKYHGRLMKDRRIFFADAPDARQRVRLALDGFMSQP
jgi:hypothetical protein